MSKEYFRQGQAALKTGAYKVAHAAFDRACAAEPQNTRYAGYRAWAKYKSATDKPSNASQGSDAWLIGVAKKNSRVVIEQAVATTSDFDDGHVFLGQMALEEHDYVKAAASFQRALRVNESNAIARQMLSECERSTPNRPVTLGRRISDWFGRVAS